MKKRRLERKFTQIILGNKDEIFELLCPVREKEWLDGWDCNIIHSESGLAEKGCVFETDNDFGKYQWVMTKYNREDYGVQFVKFIQDKMIIIIDITMIQKEAEVVLCEIAYTFTALDDTIIELMHKENTQQVFNGYI